VNKAELLDVLVELAGVAAEGDESLSALDHGLQCAYGLSMARPTDNELQLAGLVHDIGHKFGDDEEHARLGAEAVRPALGNKVAFLVGAHVDAKRYLVTTDRHYRSCLSSVSLHSLRLQGSEMSSAEMDEFASSPWAADAISLRRADEAAKVPGREVPPLEHWIPLIRGKGL
jgi:predicted HD phosphohydrolase